MKSPRCGRVEFGLLLLGWIVIMIAAIGFAWDHIASLL